MIEIQNINLAKIIAFVLFSVGWVAVAPISAAASAPAPVNVFPLGYLSNAEEEKRIGEPGAKVYPEKAAESVQAGIFDYFWQGMRK